MRSSPGNRRSSIDLSFEEGFSFLGNETNAPAERPKPTESHWPFDKDDSLDVFLPNSPSRNQTKPRFTVNSPSYAKQTFTSSIASLTKQNRGHSPLAIEKSPMYVSPMRKTPPTPMINSETTHTSKTYTPSLTKKRKRSLASSPFEPTSRTNSLEEITEIALEAEEPFIPLSERLRRYEENVEGSPVKSASEKRNSQSPQSVRSTPKRISTISLANTSKIPSHPIDNTIEGITSFSRPRNQLTPKQLPDISPVKTSDIPRYSIGFMDKSLLHGIEPKLHNHKRPFIARCENTDHSNTLVDKEVFSPVKSREIDGSKNFVNQQVANENIPDNSDINSTTTVRRLRVIDDVPPAPEPQARRHTMSERRRSQPQPLSRTIPEPFVFATDVRHEQHQRQFQEKLKQWKEREAAGHKHLASVPVPNFSRPFQVKRSTKALTKTEDFVFHSEIRSLERKMAEDERKLQQNLEKTIKRRKSGHRDREYDVHSQRSTLINSPTPSHRSRKTLTTPRSPKFSLLRSERRALRNDASVLQHNEIRRWSESVSGSLED